MTNYASILKTLYDGDFEDLAVRTFPLAKMMARNPNYGGDGVVSAAFTYDHSPARSRTFATGQTVAASQSVKTGRWLLPTPRPVDYAFAQISGEDLKASEGHEDAFMKTKKLEFDGAIKSLGQSLALGLYGDGGCTISQIASTDTTSVTLSHKRAARFLPRGSRVQFATASTGGSLRDTGDYLVVLSASPTSGIVRFDTTANNSGLVSGVSGLVAGDFIVASGDYDAGMKGLAKQIPLVEPTSGDSLYGFDRSVAPNQTAGWRLDNPGAPIESNIKAVAEDVYDMSGDAPDICLVNPVNFTQITNSLGSKVELIDQEMQANWGFQAIKIHFSGGALSVVGDPACQVNRGYVLTMSTWELYHMGPLPHLCDEDKLESLRLASSDGVEFRWRYWATPACKKPVSNGVFSITPPSV